MKNKLFIKLLDEVCQLYGFTREEVFSETKVQEIVSARQLLLKAATAKGIKAAEMRRYMKNLGYEYPFTFISYNLKTADKKAVNSKSFKEAFNNLIK